MNEYTPKRSLLAALMLALMASVSGCAVTGNAPADKSAPVHEADISDNDPLEPLNRGIFAVNEVVDGLVLKPVAHIYMGVIPDPVRHGIKNALTNLSAPVVFINSAVQGDDRNMGRTAGRFVINSTLGIAGIFDVATEFGIPKEHKKDFGQSMGVHGVGTGPFIEIPLLGPSNARDAVGMIVDIAIDPFTYILNRPTTIAINGTRIVDRRAELMPLTDRVHRDSLDPYSTFRSIYTQHRGKVVKNYLNADTAEVDNLKKK